MESSKSAVSQRVLGEPALLYLILSHLSAHELLTCAQRVCQTWNRFIWSDTRLLTTMWLHPDVHSDNGDAGSSEFNPLLQRVFPMLFKTSYFRDSFTSVGGSITPFWDINWDDGGQWTHHAEHMLMPSASWRRMLPCSPAPDRLLVNVSNSGKGEVLWLNFINKPTGETRATHPPWLTFGLLYDVIECAWHQARPWRVHNIRIDFPWVSAKSGYSPQEFVARDAVVSEELRSSARSRQGLVMLHLEADTRSEMERKAAYEEGVRGRIRLNKKPKFRPHCGNKVPIHKDIITDELHFAHALSLYEIEWDERQEYELLQSKGSATRVAVQVPALRERRFLGIRLRKK